MSLDPRRAAVLAEAESWLGTPFHHEARVKGAGVDCGQLLLEVYERVGLIPHVEVPHYPPDFHMHHDREWYAELLASYAREFAGPPEGRTPQPADVVLFRVGRVFSHGAIVAPCWPRLIHADYRVGRVCRGDATQLLRVADLRGGPRPMRCFDPF